MAKFCTRCGAPLEEGMRFCTKCGSPVGQAAGRDTSGIDRMVNEVPSSSETAQYRAASETKIAMNAPAQTAPTMQMPAANPQTQAPAYAAQPTYNFTEQNKPAARSGLSGVAKAGIAAGVIVNIGALAAILIVMHPWDQSSPASASSSANASAQSSSERSSASSASSSASSSDTSTPRSESSTSTLSDSEAKATLSTTLSQIDAFNTRVANIATDYNAHILGSSTERQNGYNNATALMQEIDTLRTSIKALSIPTNSRYFEAWSLECRLLDDLYNRIYVMQKGWERSLNSNDADYINEYIAADNVNGINRYKSDYDETRPKVSIPN